jgi:hypothetical protein
VQSSDRAGNMCDVSALHPKVEDCRKLLSAQAVGNALYGMKGMRAVTELKYVQCYYLAPKWRRVVEKLLSAQAVGIHYTE